MRLSLRARITVMFVATVLGVGLALIGLVYAYLKLTPVPGFTALRPSFSSNSAQMPSTKARFGEKASRSPAMSWRRSASEKSATTIDSANSRAHRPAGWSGRLVAQSPTTARRRRSSATA